MVTKKTKRIIIGLELFAYGIAVLILLQAMWDFGANDWSPWRMKMVWFAVGLIVLNSFVGYVSPTKGLFKIIGRQLGVGG